MSPSSAQLAGFRHHHPAHCRPKAANIPRSCAAEGEAPAAAPGCQKDGCANQADVITKVVQSSRRISGHSYESSKELQQPQPVNHNQQGEIHWILAPVPTQRAWSMPHLPLDSTIGTRHQRNAWGPHHIRRNTSFIATDPLLDLLLEGMQNYPTTQRSHHQSSDTSTRPPPSHW